MQRFEYLVRKRLGALGLFNKVLKKLDAVRAEMQQQIEYSNKAIQGHEAAILASQAAILDHHDGIRFLEAEQNKTTDTRLKIKELISG